MVSFSKKAKQVALQFDYTEYDAKQIASNRSEVVAEFISENCEETRLDELCSVLDLDTGELDNPAVEFGPEDVALAAWSNWGAGSFKRAAARSKLTQGEFIVLNDHFDTIFRMT
jgi:hypothetical protein